MATMVQNGVVTMMNTHLYEFNGSFYLQQAGGPIGLRATCAVARNVMIFWDKKWMEKMDANNVTRDLEDRYMDDVRIVLMAIQHGWRWLEGGLYYHEDWKVEDLKAGKSLEEVTHDVILNSMNETLTFLKFTKEVPEDFEDKKLPTLDLKIWLRDGRLWYQFFEKIMSNNVVIQEKSALSESVKIASLTEHVTRRLKKHQPGPTNFVQAGSLGKTKPENG